MTSKFDEMVMKHTVLVDTAAEEQLAFDYATGYVTTEAIFRLAIGRPDNEVYFLDNHIAIDKCDIRMSLSDIDALHTWAHDMLDDKEKP